MYVALRLFYQKESPLVVGISDLVGLGEAVAIMFIPFVLEALHLLLFEVRCYVTPSVKGERAVAFDDNNVVVVKEVSLTFVAFHLTPPKVAHEHGRPSQDGNESEQVESVHSHPLSATRSISSMSPSASMSCMTR